MTVRISRAALAAIRAHALAEGPDECCGLLLSGGAPGTIDAITPTTNVAADRQRRFEIDPAALIAAHRAERSGGPRIMGCYHSHPSGDPTPSTEDAAQADPSGQLWLICGGPELRVAAWLARTGGALHNVFDSMEIIEV